MWCPCQELYYKPIIPVGCNSSFITLILKVDNPILIKDYRPISLIGAQFKIVAKRLSLVLHDVIGVEQLAILKRRQIFDDSLMVNEIVAWFKRKKKKLMIFKIDFEKAYDLHFLGVLR